MYKISNYKNRCGVWGGGKNGGGIVRIIPIRNDVILAVKNVCSFIIYFTTNDWWLINSDTFMNNNQTPNFFKDFLSLQMGFIFYYRNLKLYKVHIRFLFL